MKHQFVIETVAKTKNETKSFRAQRKKHPSKQTDTDLRNYRKHTKLIRRFFPMFLTHAPKNHLFSRLPESKRILKNYYI